MSKKQITIYDLAEQLNISATTVSRGLQNHPSISKNTKKKIFDLAESLEGSKEILHITGSLHRNVYISCS